MSFPNNHNLISDAQNGFRVKKSTYTAIQSFLEDILIATDKKQFAMGIFLDLCVREKICVARKKVQ
jgi:hypothetical protein